MAWTEQCKLAFCNTAENLYIKNGNKGIVKIIKQISRESDVPFETLKRWYYQEKKIVKNDNAAIGCFEPLFSRGNIAVTYPHPAQGPGV